MPKIFIEIFNLSLAASWLILAVFLLRLIFRFRMPKWINCCLWGLVALRLLVPFTLESQFSLVPDDQFVIQETAENQAVIIENAKPSPDEEKAVSQPLADIITDNPAEKPAKPPVFNENNTQQTDNAVNNPVTDNTETAPAPVPDEKAEVKPENNGAYKENITSSVVVEAELETAPEVEENKETAPSLKEIGVGLNKKTATALSVVWAFGAALMLVYALVSAIIIKKRVALSVPFGDIVRKGEGVDSPFVFGIFRPRIYLPYGLSVETESCVIAHERAHLKRMDHLVKPFGFLVLAIYWFNPLVWLAYICLCRDIEYACDEKVINGLAPEERKAYAKALLDCAVSHRRIVACPVAFGETGVKDRIKNTIQYKKPTLRIILLGLTACIIVAALFMTTSANVGGVELTQSPDVSTEDSSDIKDFAESLGDVSEESDAIINKDDSTSHVEINSPSNESTSNNGKHVCSFGEWQTIPSTCQTAGYMVRECSCKKRQIEPLPISEHNYINGICANCGGDSFVSDYTLGQANIVGNDWGFNCVTAQASWLYYADCENIIKVNKITRTSEIIYTLPTGAAWVISVVGDWLYFPVQESVIANSYIAKVRTDGSKFEKLKTTGMVSEMLVVGDTIFYTPYNPPYKNYAKDVAPLCAMSVNGGDVTHIFDGSVSSLTADEHYIYFLYQAMDSTDKNIYKINHEGSVMGKLEIDSEHGCNVNTHQITVRNGRIYFVEIDKYDNTQKLCSIYFGGGHYRVHEEFGYFGGSLYVLEDNIYYVSGMDGMEGLVEYNVTTGKKRMIYRCDPDRYFFASEGYAFFTEYASLLMVNLPSGSTKRISRS